MVGNGTQKRTGQPRHLCGRIQLALFIDASARLAKTRCAAISGTRAERAARTFIDAPVCVLKTRDVAFSGARAGRGGANRRTPRRVSSMAPASSRRFLYVETWAEGLPKRSLRFACLVRPSATSSPGRVHASPMKGSPPIQCRCRSRSVGEIQKGGAAVLAPDTRRPVERFEFVLPLLVSFTFLSIAGRTLKVGRG